MVSERFLLTNYVFSIFKNCNWYVYNSFFSFRKLRPWRTVCWYSIFSLSLHNHYDWRFTAFCMNVSSQKMKSISEDLCFLKLCKAGRQCVVINKVATCQCVSSCPDHMHLVCGSDGHTYHNPCQLHRTACIEQRHIKVSEKGPCIGR